MKIPTPLLRLQKALDMIYAHQYKIGELQRPIIPFKEWHDLWGYKDHEEFRRCVLKLCQEGYIAVHSSPANTPWERVPDDCTYIITFDGVLFYLEGGYEDKYKREQFDREYLQTANERMESAARHTVYLTAATIALVIVGAVQAIGTILPFIAYK